MSFYAYKNTYNIRLVANVFQTSNELLYFQHCMHQRCYSTVISKLFIIQLIYIEVVNKIIIIRLCNLC